MSTTSVNGRAGLSWQQGARHVVQVTYDPAGGDPDLRVVLALTTGPVVLSWALAKGSGKGTLELGVHAASVLRSDPRRRGDRARLRRDRGLIHPPGPATTGGRRQW